MTSKNNTRTSIEIIEDLERLSHTEGFIYAFCGLVVRSLWMPESELGVVNWLERPNNQELSFLLGLMVKKPIEISYIPPKEHILDMIRAGKELLEELHHAVIQDLMSGFETWSNSGQGMVEPIFYGGADAYSNQYLNFTKERYSEDFEWIEEHKGISIDDMICIHNRIVDLIPNFRTDTNQYSGLSFEGECRYLMTAFTFSMEDIQDIDSVLLEKFLDLFSIIPGESNINADFKSVGDYNAVNSRPLVKFTGGRYLLPLFATLSDSIYESPYYWMIEDKSYRDHALEHRGDATEKIVSGIIDRVFGTSNIFRGVLIREGNMDVTDIDILALVKTKAVIIQAKSKKLTVPSRRGDQKSLKRDFQLAIQDAYEQALLCREAILGKKHIFMHDGSEVTEVLANVDEVYLLCVTGDAYPAILFQVDRYLEKNDSDPHPVVMSIFDIDVVAYYLDNPFRLVHYIRQRTNHAGYFRTDSEMSMLAFYMTHGLSPVSTADMVFIEPGMSQLIDTNYMAEHGQWPNTDQSKQLRDSSHNKLFNAIIEDLIYNNHPKVTDILFYMHDLPIAEANKLTELMEDIVDRALKLRRPSDFSIKMSHEPSGLSFMVFPKWSSDAHNRAQLYPMLRKYRSKADRWLTLITILEMPGLINAVEYDDIPWEYNHELESLAQSFTS